MKQKIVSISFKQLIEQPAHSAALAVFRILFGLMIFGSTVRFWLKGWIEELYIKPSFFFSYYGFNWVKPLDEYTYGLFFVCGVAALLFAAGVFYRWSAVVLFLSFTYIELMDKTNYLNHYYFVSLVLFLMIWLPAHTNLSVDGVCNKTIRKRFVPLWTIGSIRLMMSIVYVYAGLAKLNSDWLFNAMPLRLWLPANNDMPIIGGLFNHLWVAYAFSWFGAVYDLFISLFLLNRKTRPYAYMTVVVFHLMTAALFPIGVFPFVMILAALVFFDSKDVDGVCVWIKQKLKVTWVVTNSGLYTFAPLQKKLLHTMFIGFFVVQLLFPWRYALYPDELFWTEEGYRFSWRVMLMEKMGYAQFMVKDGTTGKQFAVNNEDYLTRNQEKMMATQPDFILQYAHLLKEQYIAQGVNSPEVYAKVYVAMNGRRSRLFVDQNVNLAAETDTWKHKKWILDFNDKIHGL